MIDGSLGEVLTAPLISLGFTCVYGARGLRLLVMYNRQLRGRWVRVLDERAVIKSLMAAYLSFEGFAWSAILLYGLNRIARMMFVVSLVDMLLTVGMCGVLAGKLRKTDDIFDVSMELQRVLQFLMAALDFEKSLRTAAETNDEVEFDTLVRIVDQYVREKSLLGVNMGAMTAEDVLKELTLTGTTQQEEKLRVLGGAAREAGRTLQDNIFYRFRETEEYRQIDMLLSPAAASDEVGEGRVPRIEQRGWHGA
eukprot:g13868.t1